MGTYQLAVHQLLAIYKLPVIDLAWMDLKRVADLPASNPACAPCGFLPAFFSSFALNNEFAGLMVESRVARSGD